MSCGFRRFVLAARVIVACLIFAAPLLWHSQPVLAASATGGSIEIVAKVTPVRLVLVDSQGKITEIQSNTSLDVPPNVYQNSYNTKPIRLTPNIRSQYSAILSHINLRRSGIVYKSPVHKTDQATPVNKRANFIVTLKSKPYPRLT